jgi:hypothetical protein
MRIAAEAEKTNNMKQCIAAAARALSYPSQLVKRQ